MSLTVGDLGCQGPTGLRGTQVHGQPQDREPGNRLDCKRSGTQPDFGGPGPWDQTEEAMCLGVTGGQGAPSPGGLQTKESREDGASWQETARLEAPAGLV